jgi:purine-nucleoside phosphorylase
MVYKSLVNKKEVLLEEFGVSKLKSRVVVCPIEWKMVFPTDWVDQLKREYIVKEVIPGDNHLRKIEKNYIVKNTLFLFVNRGLSEATDRFYILVKNPAVKEIIFVGSAASLIDELDTGDINIPRFVLPWEDMSSGYVDSFSVMPKADESLIKKITENSKVKARKYGVKILNGNNATVELIYGETTELLEFFREMNVFTIDMELSALYRLAAGFKKKAVGMLRVSDRPLHNEDFWAQKHKKKKSMGDKGRQLVFDVIKSIIV